MTKENKLVIAVSSRTLFDLNESHEIFVRDGVDAYAEYQIKNENEILSPGPGFNLIEKLLLIECAEFPIEVVLVSKNSADSGLRIFNSIEHYGIDIHRAAFTDGEDTHPYVNSFGAHLFLSSNNHEIEQSLKNGIASATILESNSSVGGDQLRIAFDGDAVLFSDESEQLYQENGLEAFENNEISKQNIPLGEGPFKKFLEVIQQIQSCFPKHDNPIRTALVTARSAPTHKRVIHTMREMGIRIDESFFLGGLNKGEFLRTFGADIFFDDHVDNCNDAREYVSTCHVPNGVNAKK